MKKIARTINVMREFPLWAFLCLAADVILTAHYSEISLQTDAVPAVYVVSLYGTFAAVFIFCFGLLLARERAEKKAAVRRRNARRKALATMYRREYYEQLNRM